MKLSVPFLLQLILVHSEPGVWDFLVAAGEASPPADALPASETAPADRLAPLGGGFVARHAAGELLQRSTQRHEGLHLQNVLCVDLRRFNGRSSSGFVAESACGIKTAQVC